MTELFSILVTMTGRPRLGSEHVLRHAERFWVARVASATPGPQSTMPAWAVTWMHPALDRIVPQAAG